MNRAGTASLKLQLFFYSDVEFFKIQRPALSFSHMNRSKTSDRVLPKCTKENHIRIFHVTEKGIQEV